MLIKDLLATLVSSGTSKYKIAKNLNVQPIMVDHYLNDSVKSPSFRVCKKAYEIYNVVLFPYKEEELK